LPSPAPHHTPQIKAIISGSEMIQPRWAPGDMASVVEHT
jgi:hypothetical protein